MFFLHIIVCCFVPEKFGEPEFCKKIVKVKYSAQINVCLPIKCYCSKGILYG